MPGCYDLVNNPFLYPTVDFVGIVRYFFSDTVNNCMWVFVGLMT